MKQFLFVSILMLFESNQVYVNMSISPEQVLFQELFENYEPSIRPVYNHQQSLTIHFNLRVNQMLELSEKDQVLGSNIVIEQVCIYINNHSNIARIQSALFYIFNKKRSG
jgi:hypothetical protein